MTIAETDAILQLREQKKIEIKMRDKKWKLAHREEVKEHGKKYRLTHQQQERERKKTWRLENIKKVKKVESQYRESPKGRINIRKNRALKRQRGFVPLNEWFEGSENHHIDKEMVIFIPQKLHTSIRHSLSRNRNMEKINTAAFNFLLGANDESITI